MRQERDEEKKRTVNRQVMEVQVIGAEAALDLDNIDLSQVKAMEKMLQRNKLVEAMIKVFRETGHLPQEDEEKEEGVEKIQEESQEDSEQMDQN